MNKGLAISTVLLLLAAVWLPLAVADDVPDYEFSSDLGDDLSAYGRGYVENLVLWSGAGVHLEWGPSFGGNATALDERFAELEAAAGGSMPNMSAPLVVPFTEVDPAFAAVAPIDMKGDWLWEGSGVMARVGLGSVAATINAETDLASDLMDGDTLDAEGLLMVLAALEAARFMEARMGWDGSVLGPVNMSDPNMTDTDASNGWWLPVTSVLGHVNETTDAWEDVVVEVENTLDGSMMALVGLLSLGDYLSRSEFLVGAGKPFPAGTDTEVLGLADALFKNIIAVYFEEPVGLFIEDEEVTTGSIAWSYMAMVDYSQTDGMVEYFQGWALAHAKALADMLVQLQNDDGTMALGFTTAVGGTPESYVPPFLPMPGVTGHVGHALAAAALFDASERFDGMVYTSAAMACLAADDANHWDDGHMVYVQDKLAETPVAYSGDQVAALIALKSAVTVGDLDLARYRVTQNVRGIVMAGLQLSETDATGEDYGIPEPDTDNDTIWKHSSDHGLGNPHGTAPVLAISSSYDHGTGNWTVDNDAMVSTQGLMMAATVLMDMDGGWFTDAGAPEVSLEHAYRLLHWTPEEWMEYSNDLADQVMNLTEQVEELERQIQNGSGSVEELMAQIASLEENLTALQDDHNQSLENETVLRNQVEWLREKLEATNETVDKLEKRIEVLESQVERLEESAVEKDENLTKLENQLRAERHNVTQLKWELENASAAVDQAESDLRASEKELEDQEQEYSDLEARLALIAVAALVAGMIIVVALLKLMGKL